MTAPTSPTSPASPAPADVAISVEGLDVRFGPVTALRDVSFSVPRGCVMAVLGANGAGKTTLLRTLSGLTPAAAGSARLDHTDLLTLPAEEMTRSGLAHVPEGRGVIAELTVEENLHLGSLGARGSGSRRFDTARVLDLFPRLADRSQQLAHSLSGGERQMLVVGRALLADPDVLLLDEPSLGLAPRVVSQILGLVRRLVDEDGITVLLAEQNAGSALSIADRALVLQLGRVVVDAAASELDRERLQQAYLGG